MGQSDQTVFITGPDPTLKLVYSDVWLPGLYSRRILCFELPEGSSHEKVVDVIQRGLKALVQGTPELGATSVLVPNAAEHDKTKPWRALAPGDGVHLVIKDLTKTFRSYKDLEAGGFPLSAFEDELFMPVAGPIMPEPQPQAKFQLSLIEGGVLLSVCIYHHLTDGNGMNTVTRALGEEAAKAAETQGALPPRVLDTDRSVMNSLNGGKTDIADHPAYRSAAHDEKAAPKEQGDTAPVPPEFRHSYFHLSHENAQALKDYASRDIPVSTHDAISAALWRNLIQARLKDGQVKEDTISTFSVPNDARKHIGLAKTWIGNCVHFITVDAKVCDIVKEDSLPALAAQIRTAINKVDREHVEGIMTIRRRDPYSLIWWPSAVLAEPQIVVITSFYHSEIMGMNWGRALGEVKHFTSTNIGAWGSMLQRAHFVGPKLAGGRGCNVHVGLLKEETDNFFRDPIWSKYFNLLEVKKVVAA